MKFLLYFLPFISSYLYSQEISIGKYKMGGAFISERLTIKKNKKFEYSTHSCEGSLIGNGFYKLNSDTLVLEFNNDIVPKMPLYSIEKFKSKNDSAYLTFNYTDEENTPVDKYLFIRCQRLNVNQFDSGIKIRPNEAISFSKNDFPIRIYFFNEQQKYKLIVTEFCDYSIHFYRQVEKVDELTSFHFPSGTRKSFKINSQGNENLSIQEIGTNATSNLIRQN